MMFWNLVNYILFENVLIQALEEKLIEEFGTDPKEMLSLIMEPEKSDVELLNEAMKVAKSLSES